MILRPTWTSPGRVVGPAWPCTGRGLPGRRVTATPVRSYRTISPLPVRPRAPSAVCFCGTFPRVSPGGRYPPPCPLVSGLSSRGTSPAIALTRRTILEPVSEPRAAAGEVGAMTRPFRKRQPAPKPPRRRATRRGRGSSRIWRSSSLSAAGRCWRAVGLLGGRSAVGGGQLNSEPQATQPSACSDRSPQTGQPATPAVRSSPRAPTTTSSSERIAPGPAPRPPRRSACRDWRRRSVDRTGVNSQTFLKTPITLPRTSCLAGDDRLVGVVLGLQADRLPLAEEALDGRLVLDHGDDDLRRCRRRRRDGRRRSRRRGCRRPASSRRGPCRA